MLQTLTNSILYIGTNYITLNIGTYLQDTNMENKHESLSKKKKILNRTAVKNFNEKTQVYSVF